jgi:hypothetical protein
VAVVVAAALVPVVVWSVPGRAPWSVAATAVWTLLATIAVVDGGWTRTETIAGLVVLVGPATLSALGDASEGIGWPEAAVVLVADAAVSLFAARRISAWSPAGAWSALVVVAVVALAAARWARGRPTPVSR